MNRKLYFLLLIFSVLIGSLSAQTKIKPQDKEYLEEAEYLFGEGYFLRALPLYLTLTNSYPEDQDLKYKLGICYLYKTDEPEKAVSILEEVKQKDPSMPGINFYLGRAYKLNYRIEEAVSTFNDYLKEKIKDADREETLRMIEQSNYTKTQISNRIDALIRNIGAPLNTENSEYAPVISADESVMIFTYRGERSKGGLQAEDFTPDPEGEYYEDIFISYRIGDNWTTPESIGDNINTTRHDANIAISADGQYLFIYKSDIKNKGDIYMSKLAGDVWGAPELLQGDVNSSSWEGSCSLSADGQTLFFSSERPGGFGGRDIYISKLGADGKWSKAENMGPSVNTKFDEDGPFIHPDGISLYFSSKGHETMGGYDIFFSYKKEDGQWSKPVNFGYPVNTVGDDRYYVLTADGKHGYYSSGAPGGFGQQDIYSVTPGVSGIKPILALIKGSVMADGKPMEAKITVYDENGTKQSTISSNAKTGKYLLALSPGKDYKLAFEIDGYDPVFQYVNTKTLDKYVEVIKDFHLYSKGYEGDKIIDNPEDLQKLIALEQEKAAKESSEIAREEKVFQEVLAKYGEERIDSVQYTVQIAAVKDPEDFKTDLTPLGQEVKKEAGPDGITRIVAGPFKTLLEAEAYRAQVIRKDSTVRSTSFVKANDRQLQEFYAEDYKKQNLKTEPKEEKIYTPEGKENAREKKPVISEEYKKILTELGNREIEGVLYKLEIASVKDEKDFKYGYLSEYGNIEKKVYPDGTIRYTIGQFKTLVDAEVFKQQVIKKYPELAEAFVTVFSLGKRKTVEEFAAEQKKEEPVAAKPCYEGPEINFSEFDGKDLNDTTYYNALIRKGGVLCGDVTYRVQIGAYRHPKNFKYPNLKIFGSAKVLDYPDGITRFTMKEFKTMAEAEAFRQQVIRKGTKDAWVTGWYKGERKLLQDLIKVNFYQKKAS